MTAFILSAEFLTGLSLGLIAGLVIGAFLGVRKGNPGNE